MDKVLLVSLGCAKNLVDSELILGLLKHSDYELVIDPEKADLIIINTCGFIEKSKRESIETILEYTKYQKKVIVTGCLVERYKEELEKEIPEVDLYIPISEYKNFTKHLSKIDKNHDYKGILGLRNDLRVLSTPSYSAYLLIGDGCDNRCSYCAIPLIRGGYRSRQYEELINEAKDLADRGIKELIVLQQDTTKYGIDLENKNIVDLLKGLLEIKEFDYIRLLYLYPDEISDELIELIGKEERLTPYFDIPIQHSETHILEAMNRRGDKEYLRKLFKKIKDRVPNAILRTTLLLGFPGESEEDVDNLISFIHEVGFDHIGAFTYSKEENTSAYYMDHQIEEEVKKKRLERVMKEAQKISYRKNKEHIGEIMKGLVVGVEGEYYLLRSYYNAPDDVDGKIYFTSKNKLELGSLTKVKINETSVYDLYGEEVH